MKKKTKLFLCFGLTLFFSIQLLHTIFDQNSWPFCSYNMFNTILPLKFTLYTAILTKADGSQQHEEVWKLLPVEFFKAYHMIEKIYIDGKDRKTQDTFSKNLLNRLNRDPWIRFDERFPSASSAHHEKFVAIEILTNEQDFTAYSAKKPLIPVKVGSVYKYENYP